MKRSISLVLCFMLAFTLCQPVFAAGNTMTWTGASNENWNLAGNWDPAQVPGDGDTAVIPESTVAVVYDNTTVTLDCSGEVSVESGGHLNLTGTSHLKGDGKLSGDGNITISVNNSELQWSGVSIEGNGTFTVEESTRLVVDTDSDVYLGRSMVNNGQIMVNDGGLLLAGGGGGTGTFAVANGAYLSFEEENYSIGGDFVNSGDVTVRDTSSVRFNAGYRQDSTGDLSLNIWGLNDFNKLEITGEAELGGVLEINFLNDYVPSPGDTFAIMTCGSRTGEFSSINSNEPGITFETAYTSTGLTLTVAAASGNVCKIGDTEYPSLDDALAAVQSGETIELLQDIDYIKNSAGNPAIVINVKNITFDLSGHTLNITNLTTDEGVSLVNRANVSFTGGGELIISSIGLGLHVDGTAEGNSIFQSDNSVDVTIFSSDAAGIYANKATINIQNGSVEGKTYGINAYNSNAITVNGPVTAANSHAVFLAGTGSTVNVGSAVVTGGTTGAGVRIEYDGSVTVGSPASPGTVTGNLAGVYAMSDTGDRAYVTVYGDVEGTSYGICCYDNAEIKVYGDVTSTSTTDTQACGVYTYADSSNSSSLIEIDGNVEGSSGVVAEGASISVKVTGNVTANGSDPDYSYGVFTHGTVEVGGNVNAAGCVGAAADANGQITVDGSISAAKYIIVTHTEKTINDKTLPTTEAGYHTYSEGTATVWVRDGGAAAVPTAPQNFTATPYSGQVALSWTAPASDGGSAIIRYEVSSDNGGTWITTATNTSHTFTGLTNGTAYTFKVRAVNSVGNGAEENVSATPAANPGGGFASGSGDGTTPETAFLIAAPEHLENVRNYLGAEHANKYFKLIEDIDLDIAPYNTGEGWEPIGNNITRFTGTFDGDEHIISSFVINRSNTEYVGLFGYTGADAEIRNLGLTGDVTGESDVGGLVGQNEGSIIDSYFTGTVTADYYYIGGLVGDNNGTITNCHTDATVTSTDDYIGGLAGGNFGQITDSYAAGTVTGDDYVGGLVGLNDSGGDYNGQITASYSTCTVVGAWDAGGLVGGNSGLIANSFATGIVTGEIDIGGLAGGNYSSITNSYATGGVEGDAAVGGLIGYNGNNDTGTATNSYWDTETSLQASSDGGTGKTTAEMKQQATFTDWDFDTIWGINGSDNNGYPFLRWQPTAVPTGPDVAPASLNITTGGTGTFTISLGQSGNEADSATVTSNDTSIATVNPAYVTTSGQAVTVTGVSAGNTTVTIGFSGGSYTGGDKTVSVTVTDPVYATHTVNFHSNGSLYAGKTVTNGSALGTNWPDNPTRSGYSFGGWFSGQNGAGTLYTSSTIINDDVDLYAKWTYNGGGSSGGGGSSTPANYASKFIETGEGGSLEFGNAAVEVPAGTLPADATLEVKQLTDEDAADLVSSGLRVKLGSDVYEITTTGDRNFGDKTLTIRIAYDPAKIAEGEQPVIRYRDETTGQWIDLPTTFEQGADGKWYAVTQVNHLTRFAVFSASAPEPVKKVIVLTLGQQAATVDGSPYTLDSMPFATGGRTMVPIRFVSEALGAEVDWNAETSQVIIKDGDKEIILTTGSANALVNGQTTVIDAAPQVTANRTFVPLRFVSETLGAQVDYNPAAKQITITG